MKWLAAAGPKLGETITEITTVSDRELALTRRTPIGLSAIELYLAANWLQSTNFPALPPITLSPPVRTMPSAPKP